MITALFESYLRDMTTAELIEEQQHLYHGRQYATSLDMKVISLKLAAIRQELFRRLFSYQNKKWKNKNSRQSCIRRDYLCLNSRKQASY